MIFSILLAFCFVAVLDHNLIHVLDRHRVAIKNSKKHPRVSIQTYKAPQRLRTK